MPHGHKRSDTGRQTARHQQEREHWELFRVVVRQGSRRLSPEADGGISSVTRSLQKQGTARRSEVVAVVMGKAARYRKGLCVVCRKSGGTRNKIRAADRAKGAERW